MTQPTVTMRFPTELHTRTKMEAARRGMRLQTLVEQAVEDSLFNRGGNFSPLQSLMKRIEALPARPRKLVASFVDLMAVAPDFYIPAIERHVQGLLTLFRRFGKQYLETSRVRTRQ